MAVIDLDTLKDSCQIKNMKSKLRLAVHFAQLNRVHAKLGVPYLYWFAKIPPDLSGLVPAFYYLSVPSTDEGRLSVLRELAPSLISFALLYKQNSDSERLKAIKSLLSDLPLSFFPEVIQKKLPEILPINSERGGGGNSDSLAHTS